MIKAHKIRLHPTQEQQGYFVKAAGTARFVWNWLRHEVACVAVGAREGHPTWCSPTSTLPRPASGAIQGWDSSWDNVPLLERV